MVDAMSGNGLFPLDGQVSRKEERGINVKMHPNKEHMQPVDICRASSEQNTFYLVVGK